MKIKQKELEIGQKYKTKHNNIVSVNKKDNCGNFIGITEGHKEQKYNADGKVKGWTFGHFLDIVLETPEENKNEREE